MQFPSAKTLALSLLVGRLAVAAPLQLNPATERSVQPYSQAIKANLEAANSLSRRRSSSVLVTPAEHLYARTVPVGNRPKNPDSGSGGGGSKSPKDGGNGSSSTGQPKLVKMPAVDTPEWTTNKQMASQKGKIIRQRLQDEVAKQGEDSGDATPVVTANSPYAARLAKWTDDYDEWDEMEYLFKRIDPDGKFDQDWPTSSIYLKNGGDMYYPALKIAGSNENQALSIQNSFRAEAGENAPPGTRFLFTAMRDLLGADGLSNLKWINCNHVRAIAIQDSRGLSLETQDAIRYAYRTLGGGTGQGTDLEINFKTPKSAAEEEVANYLSAQTHVARIMQLLKDYSASFSHKQIEKLRLINEQGEYNILIKLTD